MGSGSVCQVCELGICESGMNVGYRVCIVCWEGVWDMWCVVCPVCVMCL